jgi:hypothetical protein
MKKHSVIKLVVLSSFILFFARLLFTGVTLEDSLVVGVLGSLLGYLEYNNGQQEIREMTAKFVEITTQVEQSKRDLEELRSHVSTVKLAQQIRSSSRL